jgi:hypothetical protein
LLSHREARLQQAELSEPPRLPCTPWLLGARTLHPGARHRTRGAQATRRRSAGHDVQDPRVRFVQAPGLLDLHGAGGASDS